MAAKKTATKSKKIQARKKSQPIKTKKASAPVKSVKAAKVVLAKRRMAVPAKAQSAPNLIQKPVKMGSGLKKSEREYFRKLLLEKRREILGDVGSMESEAFKSGSNLSNMPIHMADVGTDNFEQEFTLGLIESERQILREIQDALGRVEDGTYGVCVATGKPIGRVRLEAVPWAKYTIEYSRALESGLLHRDADHHEEESSGGGDEDEE